MKIRDASKETETKVGESGLSGKALVVDEDQVGYSCYDVILKPDTTENIKSAFGDTCNHIYYCIYGEISFECSDGTKVTLKTDHLIALTGKITAKVHAASKTRLFITYVKEKEEGPHPEKAYHNSLDAILGTERDVDWFRGRSRRFLKNTDGFNISVHNTSVYAEKVSPLCYPNNKETGYYIEGHVEYTWDDGKCGHKFHQADRHDDDGASITMDLNDSHVINAKSLDSIALCVFYPALKGTETHDFSKKVSTF